MKEKICFLKSLDKISIKTVAAVIICLILLAFMLLNTTGEKSISFDLSQETSIGYAKQWTPHLTLPKGEYRVTISGSGLTDSREKLYLASTDGTKYAEFNNSSIDFKLEHDVTELMLCTDSDEISVKNITVKSDGRIFNDVYLLILLILLGFILLVYYKLFASKKDAENSMLQFALIALGVFVTYPYFTQYLQAADDLSFHLARIEGIKDGLLCGQFPVRIDPSTGAGYGYPTGLFYGNLFLYFPAVLRLCGVSIITAYKTICLGINIATALIAYYSIKEISKSRYTGFIGAAVYTLSTWRLICMVSRAAVGESISMMLLPLLILGIYHVLMGEKNKWYILSIGFTGLIQSHVINTLIGGLMVAFIVLCSLKQLFSEKRWLALLKAAGLTVLLNMWFIIPFVTAYTGIDMNIHHSQSAGNFQAGALIPAQLFNIFNDKLGISQILSGGIKEDMSLSLGILSSIGFIAALFYVVFENRNKMRNHKFFVILFIFTILVLYMATSLFPWDYLRDKFKWALFFENTLQFPWRFLTIATVILSFLTAMVIGLYTKKSRYAVTAAICIIGAIGVIMFGSTYTEQKSTYAKKGQSIIDSISLGATGEYLPYGNKPGVYVPEKYTENGSVKIIDYQKYGTNIDLSLSNAKSGDFIEVPLLYYPGYKAYDENGRLEVSNGSNGVLRVKLKDGSESIRIKYSGLLSYTFGNIITLITIIACVFWCPLRKKFGFVKIKINKRTKAQREFK